MKVVQINVTYNTGSTGRIAAEIGDLLTSSGGESTVAYGRNFLPGSSVPLKIGNKKDFLIHVLQSRLFDRHGFGSEGATKDLISSIKQIDPDIIHLHNVHGYYLHVGVLFEYLKIANKPVVWTLHDCWPFTGHCSHFLFVNCDRWQTECHHCPNTHAYPENWIIDNSRNNFIKKRELFNGLRQMVLVSPSEWLANLLRKSFLSDYEIKVINNGVDFEKFRPVIIEGLRDKFNLHKKYILGIASVWTYKKGLVDLLKLREIIDCEIDIVIVGLTPSQVKSLPAGIIGLTRIEDTDELAGLFTEAEIFVNPTYVDNFPSVNIESLACGTPVITYDTGGSPESIDKKTGIVIEKGNVNALAEAINRIMQTGKKVYTEECLIRVRKLYDKRERYMDYISTYEEIIAENELE